MPDVTIKKADLLAKIKENRENHIKEYKDAVEEYTKEAKEKLEAKLKSLSQGDLDVNIHIQKPIDETKHYDKLIEMYNWETSEYVKLSKQEFERYVLDEDPVITMAKFQNTAYSSRKG